MEVIIETYNLWLGFCLRLVTKFILKEGVFVLKKLCCVFMALVSMFGVFPGNMSEASGKKGRAGSTNERNVTNKKRAQNNNNCNNKRQKRIAKLNKNWKKHN